MFGAVDRSQLKKLSESGLPTVGRSRTRRTDSPSPQDPPGQRRPSPSPDPHRNQSTLAIWHTIPRRRRLVSEIGHKGYVYVSCTNGCYLARAPTECRALLLKISGVATLFWLTTRRVPLSCLRPKAERRRSPPPDRTEGHRTVSGDSSRGEGALRTRPDPAVRLYTI